MTSFWTAPPAKTLAATAGQDRRSGGRWTRRIRRAFLALLGLLCLGLAAMPAAAGPLEVVTDIRPVQALLAALTAGTDARVHRLMPDDADPHHAALRPSAMRRLAAANLVFVVALDLSPQVARALRSRPPAARLVELARAQGVVLHPRRRLDPPGAPASLPAGIDWHVWTDPLNVARMGEAAARALVEAAPALAPRVNTNLDRLKRRLAALDEALARQLPPLASRAYLLVHDATQYLERRYGLAPLAAVQPDHGSPPGPRRLAALMRLVRRHPGICILTPPGGAQRWARRLGSAGEVRQGMIDVLGRTLDPAAGVAFWTAYFEGLGRAYHDCLAAAPPRERP